MKAKTNKREIKTIIESAMRIFRFVMYLITLVKKRKGNENFKG